MYRRVQPFLWRTSGRNTAFLLQIHLRARRGIG
ncbi:LOW QUALITY PROTEIN: hypothetical protein TorRG33x02_167310 [Trema orientale]|uniref:Uncharacterized protein n=1 Tax=Trema orientale TaxID=63057 RepID=A0A2P5EPS6_TREOI|nr:LOW QUALITY PROTEIN: hypothetical protein TorRG33x02_167310 [Trema orientale]